MKQNSQMIHKISERLLKQNLFLFDRLLFLFKGYLFTDNAPLVLAIGAVLFQELEDKDNLRKIHFNLEKRLSKLQADPQIESDLESKLLMLLTYHWICSKSGFSRHLSLQILKNYLLFAEKEQWFGSVELALFANKFSPEISTQRSVQTFAQNKLREWDGRENLVLSSQCLIVLGDKSLPSDNMRLIEAIRKYDVKQLRTDEIAWVIIGLQTLCILADDELANKSKPIVEHLLIEFNARLKAQILNSADDLHLNNIIRQALDILPAEEKTEITIPDFDKGISIAKVTAHNNLVTVTFKDNSPLPRIMAVSIALALWTLISTNSHQIFGISDRNASELRVLVIAAENIQNKNDVVVNKRINQIVNIMALLLILLVGSVISLSQAGMTFEVSNFQINSGFLTSVLTTLIILGLGTISFTTQGSIVGSFSELPYIGKIWKALFEENKSQSK